MTGVRTLNMETVYLQIGDDSLALLGNLDCYPLQAVIRANAGGSPADDP